MKDMELKAIDGSSDGLRQSSSDMRKGCQPYMRSKTGFRPHTGRYRGDLVIMDDVNSRVDDLDVGGRTCKLKDQTCARRDYQ
jgi:hypothetical protein